MLKFENFGKKILKIKIKKLKTSIFVVIFNLIFVYMKKDQGGYGGEDQEEDPNVLSSY